MTFRGPLSSLPPQPQDRIEETWVESGNVLPPFGGRMPVGRELNWPNPYPVTWYQSWEDWFPQNLIGKDKLPNRQQDWTNPYPVTWYQSWELNLLLTTLKPAFQSPFFKLDWFNPQPITWYQSQESSYNLKLIGQDKLPNRQQDWVNPQSVIWYQNWHLNLLQTTLALGANKLSSQYDWPLSYSTQWYQNWSQNLVLGKVFAPPFSQTDWPLPTPVFRLDQFTGYNLTLNLPTPPPPPPDISTGGGRQVGWYEIEALERKSARYLRAHDAPVPQFKTPESKNPTNAQRDAAVRLGRLGGLASGISRKK